MVTLGGFITNAVYCFYQIPGTKVGAIMARNPLYVNNVLFVLWPGVLWYSQFFGLSLGKGIPCCLSVLLHILVVHPDVVNNNVLQCLGYPFEGMERCTPKTITVLVIGLAVLIISSFLPQLLG